jgi:DNA-binding GntR family transcriptional regulator
VIFDQIMNSPTLNLKKIPTKTIRQRIYETLKHKIIFGEILPGQYMTLQGLANEFGVSLMPVREALWQLESEKIVVIEMNKSIHVNTLTLSEMQEASQLRLMLEARAAAKACDRITDADRSRIKRILDSMEGALLDPERYLMLNRQFHLAIYSCADAPMLLQLIHSIWARINPYRHIIVAKFGDPSTSVKCHRNMYAALTKRDKEKLNRWLHQDLELADNLIQKNFSDFIDQGGKRK